LEQFRWFLFFFFWLDLKKKNSSVEWVKRAEIIQSDGLIKNGNSRNFTLRWRKRMKTFPQFFFFCCWKRQRPTPTTSKKKNLFT
jgi:hypothetical protein